ncbi:DUF6541 family protein [Arthrobacter russicus]|uniref:4-amino-4-deoxy-L-arabinose transferase n=1 Tax=Arthrobacter russicus TaxID=172040 RepID=A0ABU1J813_9MICC|nr:DUF6541 family protein [Arthrobacter russicus]MDR6268569.1 hypothetical protein [Arthrobacter russicus]
MQWTQLLPLVPALIGVYLIPGLMILWSAGVRGANLVALSAPISMTLVSGSAILLQLLSIKFTPLSTLAMAVLVSALTLVLRMFWNLKFMPVAPGPEAPSRLRSLMVQSDIISQPSKPITAPAVRRRNLALCLGLLLVAGIIAYNYLSAIGSLTNISQTFDDIYHLNAVKLIADTGNGSSLTLGNLTPASQGFYPAGFHDSAALVSVISGQPVNIAINAVNIFTAAVVWPLSCMFLISRIWGFSTQFLALGLVLAGSFSAFPYLSIGWGVLYPNHTAIALLPAALGLAIEACRVGHARPKRALGPLIVLIAVAPGLVMAHPSVAMALLAFMGPIILYRIVKSVQADLPDNRGKMVQWSSLGILYLLVAVVSWIYIRPDLGGAPWSANQTPSRALGEIFLSSPMGAPTPWIIAILLITGIAVAARKFRENWWLFGIFAVASILFVFSSGWGSGRLRSFIVGVWYNDSFRLAALLPTVTLPFVVLGGSFIFNYLRKKTERLSASLSRVNSKIPRSLSTANVNWGFAIFLVVVTLGSQIGTLGPIKSSIKSYFEVKQDSALLTSDALSLFEKIPDIVPVSDTIVANPLEGASLVYALANRKTVAPHVFGERSAEEKILLEHWQDATFNTQVCPVIKEKRAYWALDFEGPKITDIPDTNAGIDNLKDNPRLGIVKVAEVGKARLFRITACG